MLMELIAAFAAGFAGAGLAMILRHLTGGRLPRIIVPLMAGAGMLFITIWNEYSWFSRTTGSLPDGIAVVQTHDHSSWYRPWTYAVPFVNRFMAVDQATIRRNENFPEQRIAEILMFTHRAAISKLPLLVDCDAARRADIVDGVSFDADGAVENAEWREMEAGDPLLGAICS